MTHPIASRQKVGIFLTTNQLIFSRLTLTESFARRTHIYAYIYIYICTHMHTFICTHMHTYAHICTHMHTYVHTYMRLHTYTQRYTYIHAYMHEFILQTQHPPLSHRPQTMGK